MGSVPIATIRINIESDYEAGKALCRKPNLNTVSKVCARVLDGAKVTLQFLTSVS